MDFSEGIAHEVAVKTINVRHLIDASPSTVSIARELRYCIIVIAVSWASFTPFYHQGGLRDREQEDITAFSVAFVAHLFPALVQNIRILI
jgi:hypothetical protein